jgi:purine nucleosidase
MDFNVCCDPHAAQLVFAASPALTLVSLTASIKAHVRAADVPRLQAAGPMGGLLARQALAVAEQFDNRALGRAHAALPDDLLNFLWDPVTCAVAAGWAGCTIGEERVVFDPAAGHFARSPAGQLVPVVRDVDADAFREVWLRRIVALATES